MSSLAPGQFFGYALQIPRAVFHLLNGKEGDRVCIEVHGDVSTISVSGEVISEEDKASTIGNPVTDRSVDLWKTFYNWLKGCDSGQLVLTKTTFILYRNSSRGNSGLAQVFNDVNTKEDAKAAIIQATTKLADVKESHDIWDYYQFVIKHPDFSILLQRFTLESGDGIGFEELKKFLIRPMLIPETHVDFACKTLNGWLQERVMTLIAKKELAIISWEEYKKEFQQILLRCRQRELIDFASEDIEVVEGEAIMHMKQRPTYVRQLELINYPEEDIIEAVHLFHRASVNRQKWIERDLIDVKTAEEFEKKLFSFWKNNKITVDLTNKTISPEERGKILLANCYNRQETIGQLTPPHGTVSGTFHDLANTPTIGWHETWEQSFKKTE
jgi:hypothetical protein